MISFLSNSFIFWIIFISFNSQSTISNDSFQKLKKILDKEFKIDSNIDKIIVLNHRGCFACNKEYSTFWENADSLDFSTVAFVFTKKDLLDTEPLLKNIKPAQIVYDYRELLFRYDFIKENSAYIQLQENAIDTILNVRLNTIEDDLAYISKQLKMESK